MKGVRKMLISSRGRYALRVLVDLAEHSGEGLIPMKDVAGRQNISLKYLEKILPALSKNGFVECRHGTGGGYKLAVSPRDCRVGDVLRLTEGDLAPVSCLCSGAECANSPRCRTYPMWEKFGRMINDFFDGITIADLMQQG